MQSRLKKHIYDYVITGSNVEMEFASNFNMESSDNSVEYNC